MEEPIDISNNRFRRKLSEVRYRRYYSRNREKIAKDYITDKDLERICKYLKNPISSGLWLFKGKWHGAEGVTNEVIKELKDLEKSRIKTKENKRIKDANADLLEITSRMTFTLSLFDYMAHSVRSRKRKNIFYSLRDEYRFIERLNLKNLNRKYQREMDCFRNRIFLEGFNPKIAQGLFTYTKSGLVFLKERETSSENDSERSNWSFTFVALQFEPLEGLAEFFNGLGKISDYTIAPLYSPEEEVFEPYFSFLELVCDRLFQKAKIRTLIEQSISIFDSKNYPYCISTIGLILEEQLTQIYETLFRDRCPQGSTLGALLDLIEKRVRNTVVHADHKKAIDVNSIYERINNSLERNTSSPATNEDLLKIIRDLLTFVKENNKQIISKLASPQKKESISIFPNELRDGMDELIMYRNAISHRSRIPIGSFETQKSIHHMSSLIMWWNEEMKLMDWKHNSDLIIKDMIRRNNPQVAGQIP
jgi:hypothetical protein